MRQPSVGSAPHNGTENNIAAVRVSFDAVDRVKLVEVICICRVAADVAPRERKRHFARFVRHHAIRRTVFFDQLKSVFTGERLHKFIVGAEAVVIRFVTCREEIGKSCHIALLGIPFLVLGMELLLRLEVEIDPACRVVLLDNLLNFIVDSVGKIIKSFVVPGASIVIAPHVTEVHGVAAAEQTYGLKSVAQLQTLVLNRQADNR